MNYLAHLFLAGNNHGKILGALLEDYIRGGIENEKNRTLPEDVKAGLRLHRHIDTFTDTDPTVGKIKQKFYTPFGKYSGVIVDVLLDHFVQKHWDLFAQEPFSDFRSRIYQSLTTQYTELHPLPLKKLIASMVEHDWLQNYLYFWGLEKAMSSLNRRVHGVDLVESVSVFKNHYEEIEADFLEYFPRLIASTTNELP